MSWGRVRALLFVLYEYEDHLSFNWV